MIMMIRICIFCCIVFWGGLHTTAQTPVYKNKNEKIDQRVKDLLSRMTLDEKIAQMCQYVGIEHLQAREKKMNEHKKQDFFAFYPGLTGSDIEQMVSQGMIGSFLHVVTPAEANKLQRLAMKSRLQIPLLIGIDAIHGNALVSGCTVFPSPISISCSWDTALIRKSAEVTAAEMRATGSQWSFSPNLDVARDARWGRIGETYGEDPFLVAEIGKVMIEGLQGSESDNRPKVSACAKHLIAGSEPINGLNVAPTDLSERTLEEIYYPPFKAAIKAGVHTIMPAHNEINGIPCHANKFLMTDLLRKRWGFQGFYISDFLDIERLAEIHRVASNQKEAVYKSVKAGMDMHMHGPDFHEPIKQLLKDGLLTEDRINESVRRILEVKFRLGLFEEAVIDEKNMSNNIFTKEYQKLALEAARRSIVLLKNDSVLPLQEKHKRILVTGPNADNQTILGDWSLRQPDENVITVLEGIKNEMNGKAMVDFVSVGGSTHKIKKEDINHAVQAALLADVIVVALGENALRFDGGNRNSGENVDRDDINPAGLQTDLVEALAAVGKPVVVVLINGRPLSVGRIKEVATAIIEAWEPGSMGGQAIAEILSGKVNPSGKLTISFPRSVGQIPVYYNHKPSQYARSYWGTSSEPLFVFGEGLSYTSYVYSDVSLEKDSIKRGEATRLSVNIKNSGKYDGEEIVQLYINYPVSDITRAVKELKAFQRISLKSGETKKVVFDISPEMLTHFDVDLQESIETGKYTIFVGASSKKGDLLMRYLDVH